jgi:hypothetical protein
MRRFLHQVWADIVWFDSQIGTAMKLISAAVSVLLLVGGLYLGKEWWKSNEEIPRIILLLLASSLVLVCYLISAGLRARVPVLEVGRLLPVLNQQKTDGFFQLRVKNLGPGSVRPIVKITYLRDGKGDFLPIDKAFTEREVHWRGWNDKEHHLYLDELAQAYAGVIWVERLTSDPPQLLLLPINLVGEELLPNPPKLGSQTGLRIRLTVTARQKNIEVRDTRVMERSYVIKPDRSKPIKYKAKRVWIRSLFWS